MCVCVCVGPAGLEAIWEFFHVITRIYIRVHLYVYIYLYVCICVCWPRESRGQVAILQGELVYMYIYIYMYICMYVYLCVLAPRVLRPQGNSSR